MLKEMLKESNKTQLDEKEEDITRLKNEKEDMKVDDEISVDGQNWPLVNWRSERYMLMLKEMIKESNKTQLEEKEEEITRLNNEKEYMKVDDEISKSFETIIHLKTQIEEAKRAE